MVSFRRRWLVRIFFSLRPNDDESGKGRSSRNRRACLSGKCKHLELSKKETNVDKCWLIVAGRLKEEVRKFSIKTVFGDWNCLINNSNFYDDWMLGAANL